MSFRWRDTPCYDAMLTLEYILRFPIRNLAQTWHQPEGRHSARAGCIEREYVRGTKGRYQVAVGADAEESRESKVSEHSDSRSWW
jgi:hypothetical protein